MARAMGTNAYGKEPRRGERTLSRGFTHRRARRAFLRPYGAGASLGRSHRAYALGVPQGLRPGLFSSAPNGASNRARTRLARRDDLGIKAQTRVENVETPGPSFARMHKAEPYATYCLAGAFFGAGGAAFLAGAA